MRRERMSAPALLSALVLAVLLSYSGLMCLNDAYGLGADPVRLLAVCCGASLLAVLTLWPRRSWPLTMAAAALYLLLLLWKQEAFKASILGAAWQVSREFALCYSHIQPVGEAGGDALWILSAIAVPLVWLTAWVTGREGSLVLLILAYAPILILSLMIVDLAPVLWLILLTGGLMLLVLSHNVRERNSREGSRLIWWLMLPVITLFCAITALWPPADYVRADWTAPLQTITQTQTALQTWQSETFTQLPRWNQSLREVDLSELGPKSLTGEPALDYRSDRHISYLRGVSLGLYEDNAWKALPSAEYHAHGFKSSSLVSGADAPNSLEIQTVRREPQLYTTYHLSSLPSAGAPVDDAYIQNTDRLLTYTSSFSILADPATEPTYDEYVLEAYTQIPEELAQPLTAFLEEHGLLNASPQEIVDFVRGWAEYDLNTPQLPNGEEFVLYFLQESRRGYCVHFASAAVLLLRAGGFPARYVTGYAVDGPAGQWNSVTENDAHAWVEFYTGSFGGWMSLEATPVSDEPQLPGAEPTSPEQPPDLPEPENPSEPEPQPEDQPTVPIPDAVSGGPASSPLPLELLWLLCIPGVLFLLWLRRALALRYRRERTQKGHPNRRLMAYWRWLLQLNKLEHRTVEEELLCLAEKARFSQHEMTEAEIARLQAAVEDRIQRLKQAPLGKRLWYQYGLAFF